MPSEIKMPQQSDTMTEGTVVKWLKREGEAVKSGEIIAEIETDKAVMEMESFSGGTVAALLVGEGQKVPVGTVLAIVAAANENAADVKKQFSGAAAGAAAGSAKSAASAASPSASAQSATSATKVQSAAQARGGMEEEPAGGRGSHAVTSPTTQTINAQANAQTTATATASLAGNGAGGRIFASPLARRMAADKGIDLSQIAGTGPGGRIVQKDVADFKPSAAPAKSDGAASAKPQAELPQRVSRGQTDVQPLSKMRAAIATALQRSKQQIPHFYVTVDVDVEELFNLRGRLNKAMEKEGVKVSVNDFVTKAVCAALQKHPAVNAHFTGDSITRFGDVHIGVAVAIPDGLIVPVIKNADQMGLKELQQRTAELAKKAKAQKLKGDEMKGATFTISNLGMFGVKDFSAIINPPEVAILAVAAAEKRAVVRNDQVVPRWTMSLTLSVDHRAVDGATAAEFMRTLKGLLEEPGMMLV